MARFSPFSSRRLGDFIYEFNSMLDPVEDAYDFGIEAQKFYDAQPLSINFIANGVMEVLYFTDSYVMEWVANLIFDIFDDIEIGVRNLFD